MHNLGDFRENYNEEYYILGDWYLYNGADEGLTFVVKRKDGHEVKEMFLPFEEMNNIFQFKKDKNEDVHLIARGIEEGEENKLVIRHGQIPSPTLMNKEKMLNAKIVTYYLKRK